MSLQIDGESAICEEGLNGIPLKVNDGTNKDSYEFIMQVETNYKACTVNEASREQASLSISAALLIGTVGMLASKKQPKENTNNKTNVSEKVIENETKKHINLLPKIDHSHTNTM